MNSFMESDVDKVNSTVSWISVLLQIHWGQVGRDLLIQIPFIDSNIDKPNPILNKHTEESRQQWSAMFEFSWTNDCMYFCV